MTAHNDIPTVVIDIDNTIIDTAVRKESLLNSHFDLEVDLNEVRRDYHLTGCLGENNTISSRFFEMLDTPEVIQKYPAPAMQGASETIQWLKGKNFNIILLTARPETCRTATLEELRKENIKCDTENLLMRDGTKFSPFSYELAFKFKEEMYYNLSCKYQIIAGIGDRPEDILAAQRANVPAVLITSTVKDDEVKHIRSAETTGIEIAASWPEVAVALQRIYSGIAQMEKLRELFISQYAKWLYDIDHKIKIVVAISSFVSAIVGYQLIQTKPFDFTSLLLALTMFLSTFSVLYCIRGLTSRRTSGRFAPTELRGHFKQFISILLGWPQSWIYRKGDAIDNFNKLRKLSSQEKISAHLSFFHNEYETYNAQALLNLRMFELRSAVYAKSYAERIASKLLMVAIVILLSWILISTIMKLPSEELDTPVYSSKPNAGHN